MNKKVYIATAILILISLGLVATKVIYGGQKVASNYSPHLWRINIEMHLKGKGERAKIRLTLPKDTDRQTIYNEHFENDELVFYVRQHAITENRVGYWRAEILDGSKTIQYTFSVQLRSLNFPIPQNVELPEDPGAAYPPDFKKWIDPSDLIQSEDKNIQRYMKKIIGREKDVALATKKIFDFVRGEVKYRSEKGSKDAKATLDVLEADCGGKARLFAALSRAAGIPSRVVGGLILTGGVKNTTHVWVENYIGGMWVPFDVVNNHYAFIPNHYLELYRGDYSLIKHLGLSRFEYFFVIGTERIPPVDNPWSLYVLPIHFQGMIKVLLLIPVGALVVALFRTVIGIPTFGTFSPILLALAFREVTIEVGLLCLGIVVLFGWILRKVLDQLRILIIPRLAIIVTMVVITVLIMMVLGFHMNQQKILYISLFPMVIMTWTIERFSVIQIEDGTPAAIKSALGTVLVASAAYYLMRLHPLRAYLFAFPELLLAIMGILMLLGRYTGLRLTELWRFKELNRYHQEKSRAQS